MAVVRETSSAAVGATMRRLPAILSEFTSAWERRPGAIDRGVS